MPLKRVLFPLSGITLLLLISLGCNLSGSEETEGEVGATETRWAEETSAALTRTAAPTEPPAPDFSTPTPTSDSTATPEATATLQPTNTSTQIPCDRAAFVEDVTIPDGTKLGPGATFTKTWRLRNTGSCAWDSTYDLVFVSSDSMGGQAAVQLTTSNVAPGQTVEASIQLTAPSSSGTYRGNYKLRNGSGGIFGVGGGDVAFWVEIDVVVPTATNTNTPSQPDLYISEFSLDPATPTKGNPVDVRVGVYNQGNAVAGSFTVAWWPGENYTSPACTWTIASLVANGGRILTCTYAGYPSQYGSIVTKVVADTSNTVAESDESNNIGTITISVNP